MRKSSKFCIYFLVFAILFVTGISAFSFRSYADDAAVTLSIWPQEADVGETVTVTITIKGDDIANCSFALNYPANLVSTSSGSDGVVQISSTGPTQVQFTFKTQAEGDAYFSTTAGQFTNAEGQALSVTPAGGTLPIGKKAEKETTEEKTTEEKKTEESDEDSEEDSEKEEGFEYKLDGISFTILNDVDEKLIPAGFEKTPLKIDGKEVNAYKDIYTGELYVVMAKNSQGKVGPYYFDLLNSTLSDYKPIETVIDAATATNASTEAASSSDTKSGPIIPETRYIDKEEEEGFFTRTVLKRLLMMMAFLFVITCVIIIILIVKNGNLQSMLEGEGDDGNKKKEIKEKKEKSLEERLTIKPGKGHSYGVNEDTGEILIEDAEDNNASVDVPPATDGISDIEKAMRERPYGVDSAFDVVAPPDEEGAPDEENAPKEESAPIKESAPKESESDEAETEEAEPSDDYKQTEDGEPQELDQSTTHYKSIFDRMEALKEEHDKASNAEDVHEVLPDTVELTEDDMEYIGKMTQDFENDEPEASEELQEASKDVQESVAERKRVVLPGQFEDDN